MGILMAMFNGDMNISQLIGWRYSKIWRIHLDLRVKRWVPVCFSFFTNPVNITNDMRWAWLKMEHTSNLVYCSIFHWDKPKNCWAWHLLVFPWGNFSDPIDPPSGHWRFFLPTISRDIAEMVNCPITNWKDPPCLMGKSTINGHFQ